MKSKVIPFPKARPEISSDHDKVARDAVQETLGVMTDHPTPPRLRRLAEELGRALDQKLSRDEDQ